MNLFSFAIFNFKSTSILNKVKIILYTDDIRIASGDSIETDENINFFIDYDIKNIVDDDNEILDATLDIYKSFMKLYLNKKKYRVLLEENYNNFMDFYHAIHKD